MAYSHLLYIIYLSFIIYLYSCLSSDLALAHQQVDMQFTSTVWSCSSFSLNMLIICDLRDLEMKQKER